MMKLLTFSTLYPSGVNPNHGIFVETRLRHLLASGRVEAKVVAPVPWFPSTNPRFGAYAVMARAPRSEVHNGIEVLHPRYPLPPRVGMTIAPFLLAAWALPTVERLLRGGFDFDLIDAHYYYPDGVAAGIIARHLGKPYVVTARGTDLNLIPRYALPRRMIRWTAARAAASISVCTALRDQLAALGVDTTRLRVLRNGVDLQRFVPVDQAQCRRKLGLEDRQTFISVGHLVERKGHDIAIRALADFPDAQLVIVGTGDLHGELERRADICGVRSRTIFVGGVPQPDLKYYYSAADALVLASSREGWPNVLLEAMACGTPVVATRVWGSPEVVTSPEAGVLCDERSDKGIAHGIRRLLDVYPDRTATRRFAEGFGWDETTRGQIELFESIVGAAGDSALARGYLPT